MDTRSHLVRLYLVGTALLLLGIAGVYWPQWIGAAPTRSTQGPAATIADAVTYQGYLTDSQGMPLSGSFTMRFEIYNAESGGVLLWDGGDVAVLVEDGLFDARLAIDTDIFNGEELWIVQTIDGETLTPRQEMLPAPMAHTVRPGAIVKGTASAIPNNYLFDAQMNNDTFGFNRGAIFAQATTGNALHGFAQNGRALYGQTADGYAIYGFDGGSNANRGYAGYFYSTNGIGVYGYSNGDRSHPNIFAPGVYGQSNQGVGVYGRGDTSDSHTFYNEGGYFEGGKGLYARGTDSAVQQGYGARIFSDEYRGMFVRGGGGHFDAYFGGTSGISTNGIVDRAANQQSLVVNLGAAAIEPGDLVAMVGVASSLEDDQPMLGVAGLDHENRAAVIGVAVTATAAETLVADDGTHLVNFAPVAGAAPPDGHLIIVTGGLAPAVNVDSLTPAGEWAVGDRLSLVDDNALVKASAADAGGITIGKVAGTLNSADNTVPVFIDID